jgi:hypothetical protein
MGISVGCQVLSRVVDSLFGDLKHKFVYNFMDDLVVYSDSIDEHLGHLKEVFMRLEKAGFSEPGQAPSGPTRNFLFGTLDFGSGSSGPAGAHRSD